MKRLLLAIVFAAMTLHAQVDSLDGLWQGYDGECVASGAGRSLDKRDLHAYRDGELLSAELHRA